MCIVDLHISAKQDLRKIRNENLEAFTDVLALLEVIRDDPAAIDKLTTHGNVTFADDNVNVKKWINARPENLWRFRLLDTPATVYRVVYGYHWQTRTVHVLAVVHKEEFDYDNLQSDLGRRILSDWKDSTE